MHISCPVSTCTFPGSRHLRFLVLLVLLVTVFLSCLSPVIGQTPRVRPQPRLQPQLQLRPQLRPQPQQQQQQQHLQQQPQPQQQQLQQQLQQQPQQQQLQQHLQQQLQPQHFNTNEAVRIPKMPVLERVSRGTADPAASVAPVSPVTSVDGAGPSPFPLPRIRVDIDPAENRGQLGASLQILLLLTVLSLAPSILIMLTSFTRILIVLNFVRRALSTQQEPSNQILIGLSLFLTFFIMSPVLDKVHSNAIRPFLAQEIDHIEAYHRGIAPIRDFMFRHARKTDLALFASIEGGNKPVNKDEFTTVALVPAFLISEIRTAFQMGVIIFLPFLVIDLVVASLLMSMGMMMLPPVMISLPFKILLFVLVDGWNLVIRSLVISFGGAAV